MSKTIIISSQNYVANSNNTFTYNLPNECVFESTSKVGLQAVYMYNSTFNISSKIGNNTFQIIWNANTTTTYNVTIPDGYYSGSDLNYFIQSQFVANNLYMTTNSGTNFEYFTEILVNSIRYAFQINTYPLPTASQATTIGFSMPSQATWTLPTVSCSPQIVLCLGLGVLLGFNKTLTYPTLSTFGSNQTYLSDSTPIISPVNSYLLTLNLINSNLSIPTNIFYSIPLNVSFGSLISIGNSDIIYNQISPGRYRHFTVQFIDQNYNTLYLNDTEVVIVLSIIE